jgi:hypothetical protein
LKFIQEPRPEKAVSGRRIAVAIDRQKQFFDLLTPAFAGCSGRLDLFGFRASLNRSALQRFELHSNAKMIKQQNVKGKGALADIDTGAHLTRRPAPRSVECSAFIPIGRIPSRSAIAIPICLNRPSDRGVRTRMAGASTTNVREKSPEGVSVKV